MTERSKVSVETEYSEYLNSLILVEKDVIGLDNSFFFQILIGKGGHRKLFSRVEDSDLSEIEITDKEFISLQDNIRKVIDTAGNAVTIKLDTHSVQFVHFPNGEIGVGIGKGKYLLEKENAELLREFCAKTM